MTEPAVTPLLDRLPGRVTLVEVGPRDGLQNERRTLAPADRVALIDALAAAGLKAVEAGAFVSPDRVPQMAGTADVLAGLGARPELRLPVLVPNARGLDDALAAGVREVAVFGAASETFSRRNINCSIAESLVRFTEVTKRAMAAGVAVRGYVSCVLGCPYEGPIAPEAVRQVAASLFDLGCFEVSLGDTIGIGTPGGMSGLLDVVTRTISADRLAVHCHDTYGQALANILVALGAGISVVDCAVAGLGGCPYAPGASGNVATEDVVHMLDGLGIATGVDANRLLDASRLAVALVGHPPQGRVARARLAADACDGRDG